jgi:hypothetical protein
VGSRPAMAVEAEAEVEVEVEAGGCLLQSFELYEAESVSASLPNRNGCCPCRVVVLPPDFCCADAWCALLDSGKDGASFEVCMFAREMVARLGRVI